MLLTLFLSRLHNHYPARKGTPFARVLLRAERERFSSGAAIHCAHGRLGHRPVRRVSDREVLAALVPERVLPFASGGSRKRGLSRAEAKTSDAAVGRRKASAPAPFFEVPAASVLRKGDGERTRAASLFDAAPARAYRRSASLLLREEFLGNAFWLGFSWRRQKLGCEGASRQRMDACRNRTFLKGHFLKGHQAMARRRPI